MNAGLSNLDRLKAHLLPAGSMQGETRFDQVITDIGQGVAETFENECNRQFDRVEGYEVIFQADRASFVLPRYPVEVLTEVALDMADGNGFVVQAPTFIQSISLASGIVYMQERPDSGPYYAEVRFTFTGGYWWEKLEPDDDGYPSTQPAGSAALPRDLLLAWFNQCRAEWAAYDKLGTGLVDKPGAQTLIGDLEFSPAVKRTLGNYALMQPI